MGSISILQGRIYIKLKLITKRGVGWMSTKDCSPQNSSVVVPSLLFSETNRCRAALLRFSFGAVIGFYDSIEGLLGLESPML